MRRLWGAAALVLALSGCGAATASAPASPSAATATVSAPSACQAYAAVYNDFADAAKAGDSIAMQARLEQMAGKLTSVAALAGNPDMASLITRVGPTATTWSAMLAAGIGQQGAQNDFSITNSDVVSGCSVDRDPISEHPSS